MSVKKASPQSTSVSRKIVVKSPVKPIARSISELRRKAALKHSQVTTKVPKPEVQPPAPKATLYMLKFDDGTVRVARGEHAKVLADYMMECEKICTNENLVYYQGPMMEKYTAEEWESIEASEVSEAGE